MKKAFKSKSYKDKLKGHKDGILKIYSPYGPDSGLLLSASQDGCIRAWDLIDRKITTKLFLSREGRESASQFQQDDQRQYNDEDDNGVGVAATNGGVNANQEEYQNHESSKIGQFCAASFSENSVYAGFADGLICSWNMRTGDLSSVFKGHSKEITEMEFLNSRLLVTSSLDGTIRVWDTMNGSNETIYSLQEPVNMLKINGKRIQAILSKDTYVEINADTQKIDRRLKFTSTSITNFVTDQQNLIIATLDNIMEVYDLVALQAQVQAEDEGSGSSGILQPTYIVENGDWILCMKVLDRYLYTGCDDKRIKVWDLDKKLTQVEDFVGHEDGVGCLEFADNMLYSGSFDHSIRSWNLREMESRIHERMKMFREDIWSRKYEAWYKIFFKNKKKKKGGKAKSSSSGGKKGGKKKKKK